MRTPTLPTTVPVTSQPTTVPVTTHAVDHATDLGAVRQAAESLECGTRVLRGGSREHCQCGGRAGVERVVCAEYLKVAHRDDPTLLSVRVAPDHVLVAEEGGGCSGERGGREGHRPRARGKVRSHAVIVCAIDEPVGSRTVVCDPHLRRGI